MNKPIYLGLSILDLGKTVMYEFWYDNIKPKYGDKTRFFLHGYRHCLYDSLTVCVRTDDMYKDIRENMLKLKLTIQTMNETDHSQKEKTKKLLV